VCGRRMEEVAVEQEVKDDLCTQSVLNKLGARTEATNGTRNPAMPFGAAI
jgi:hypothetical protein